jgi:hypothetical protein
MSLRSALVLWKIFRLVVELIDPLVQSRRSTAS